MNKIAVVAIGGNSLIKDKSHQTVEDQYEAVKETAVHIADLIESGFNVVITHGNGPQVGFILLRSEIAKKVINLHPVPLDACGADTQGAIGYAIQRALRNEFRKRGKEKDVVTVVTMVVVDKNDPAFQNPSKPIGPFYTEEEAKEKIEAEKWIMKEDAGRGWRRVVPSPIPRKIVEINAIKTLVEKGFVVVGVGGGGIPVIEDDENGQIVGVEAVIDKDYASSLLARELGADYFIISTAVEKVYLNFGTPDQKPIDRMTLEEARKYLKEGHFKEGSMAPKIRAVIEFLEAGGEAAIITSPESIVRAIKGETGTWIVPA
ncbi:MAG: carbamate kinase [Candidatus Hydrothermae bacterium]|nr:carbamate kinase [Candidatus Hydrothermae bacterium]